MVKIKVGDEFPEFEAFDKYGKKITLSKLKGKKVIVYFYPKDNTPGCTIEANEFNENLTNFKEKAVNIIGVSRDSRRSHEGFCRKFDLQFPLVTDNGGKIGKELGILKITGLHSRTTFLLDENGKVEKIFEKVKAEGHAREVLNLLNK
jgi:thioredoxin-dependent peroxiredoxin